MEREPLFAHSLSPCIEDIKVYFNQKGMPQAEAEHFYMFYELKKWTSKKGNFYKSWKNLAHNWIVFAFSQQRALFNRHIH